MKLNDKTFLYLLLLFTASFILLIHLIPHDLYWGESAILTSRAWQLGGSHPPGYPVFLQMVHSAQKLIFFGSIPLRANITGIVFLSLFTALLGILLTGLDVPLFLSVSLSLTFSLIPAVLKSTLPVEVYSLNLFFCVLTFLCVLKFEQSFKFIYLTMFISGIAVTHHLTFIFCFPGLLLVLKSIMTKTTNPLRTSTICLIMFLLGLSSWIYLPVREQTSNLVVWGNPQSFSGFLDLITAKEESTGSLLSGLSSISSVWKKTRSIIIMIMNSLTVYGIILSISGSLITIRWKKHLAMVTIPFFILLSAAVVVYNSNESSAFYLPGLLILWIWGVSGFNYIYKKFSRAENATVRKTRYIVGCVPIIICVCMYMSASSRETSIDRTPRYLSSYRLNISPPDSVIISRRSDYCFLNWYLNEVEKRNHRQITVFQHLLSFKWYYDDLVEKNSINNNLSNYGFEDSREWNSVVTAFLTNNALKERPVIYSDYETVQDVNMVNYRKLSPQPLSLGFFVNKDFQWSSDYPLNIGLLLSGDDLSKMVVASELGRQGFVFEISGDIQRAEEMYKKSSFILQLCSDSKTR